METLITTAVGFFISWFVQLAKKLGASPRGALVFFAIIVGSFYAGYEFYVEEALRFEIEEFVLLCVGQASLIYAFLFKFFESDDLKN